MRQQSWFEMIDVKCGIYGEGEWTPLWVYEVSHEGDMFSAPYREEIFRIRTLFAPLVNRARLFDHWIDLDSDGVYPCVDQGNYCKPGVYYFDSRNGEEAGEYSVFKFCTVGGETCELQINQDLVAALQLIHKDDSWIRPAEGGQIAIRLGKDDKGEVVRAEIRTEYLRDYLCARGMGLYIEEFRHRQEQDRDGRSILWQNSPVVECRRSRCGNGKYEWKGWMFKHQDGNSWDDAQAISAEVLFEPQYYRVEGQLWKQFWINPAQRSERVAGDDSGFEYYVKPSGERHTISPLDDDEFGHVYLFFRSDLVTHALSAGLQIIWEARDVFSIRFPGGQRILFGISGVGTCFCISADVARLAAWEQKLLHGDNIKPQEQDEYVGSELFQNQMMCEFLHTKAPENEFRRLLDELGLAFKKRTGDDLWRKMDCEDDVILEVSRFCSLSQGGYVLLAKRITNAMIERMDVDILKKFIDGRVETAQLKTIGLLSAVISLITGDVDAGKRVRFMRDVNFIRQADAHFMSVDDVMHRINVLPMPDDLGWIERGARLIEYANQGLQDLVTVFRR